MKGGMIFFNSKKALHTKMEDFPKKMMLPLVNSLHANEELDGRRTTPPYSS